MPLASVGHKDSRKPVHQRPGNRPKSMHNRQTAEMQRSVDRIQDSADLDRLLMACLTPLAWSFRSRGLLFDVFEERRRSIMVVLRDPRPTGSPAKFNLNVTRVGSFPTFSLRKQTSATLLLGDTDHGPVHKQAL